jgi:nicotinate-nucleotide adenylyltransferase
VEPEHPASIGILGGTFNPPHLGHLALARFAREQLGLRRVALTPAHTSPFKRAAPDPGPEHRLRMCALLVRGEPGLSACPLEVDRGGVSYTVDTLTAIHASHPDAELTFIVGADTANTLPDWRDPEGVLALASLAVAAREGTSREDVLERLRSIRSCASANGQQARPVCFLDMPHVDVSSSLARERAAAGEPLAALVGADVAAYIADHGLYGGDG